jgi:hypothetical protein
MIAQGYLEFCEALWSQWLKGPLNLPPRISARFELEHAPEPYIRFGDGKVPFYVLLTNPGKGMQHQRRDEIVAGKSCINRRMSYHDASLKLADFYSQHLRRGAARRKNEAMDSFKELVKADCIVQFESLPFHSPSLPGKRKLLALVKTTALLNTYASVLTEAMKDVSVVAVSAVHSGQSISTSSIARSPWLTWQASLFGIDPDRLKLTKLLEKGGTITQAFVYQRVNQCTRGFVLTMGGAPFPSAEGRKILARTLASSKQLTTKCS